MCDKLYLYIESGWGDAALSFDDQREINVKNVDEEMAKEIVKIITSEIYLTVKKMRCSKARVDIEFENPSGAKFRLRLLIMKMMPVSEVELNHLFANSVW
jgi:hypothetical protein